MWVEIADDTRLLTAGSSIRINATFARVPFTSPSRSDVLSALSSGVPEMTVTSVGDSILGLDFGGWDIYGVLLLDVPVGELREKVRRALNWWNTWSAQVQKIEVDSGTRLPDVAGPAERALWWVLGLGAVGVVGLLLWRQVK